MDQHQSEERISGQETLLKQWRNLPIKSSARAFIGMFWDPYLVIWESNLTRLQSIAILL